ncbi:serine/threonine-protein kinase [Lignipirellula cremea]|uniref:Serine/threonine-protein kinase PknB n=1 Tax=Lignipirellula cremea TaxID=2528010 RepID=A0A518DQC0_9BACT|nr:serine/threonine-protein kinase [Lignipirellula cremea]QDU94029.1 Serine/threonine-protein kinase PknB [Lignipirellula cremea]
MTTPCETSLVGRTIDCWETGGAIPVLEVLLQGMSQASVRDRADAILVDQSFRWQRGVPIPAEEYLSRCPEIAADSELRLDIVFGEFRARAGEGGALLEEFRQRFPDLADALVEQQQVSQWLDSDVAATETIMTMRDAVETQVPFDPAPLQFADFELQKRLGRGGMGEVHQALQRSLNKPVAIKILRRQFDVSQELVDRFFREARAVASLKHPHIVGVHGVGRCPQDGGYFQVMDLIDGPTLQEELDAGPYPFQEAAQIVADAAGALQHAHDRGVIHRDLKPTNVMRASDGRVVVVDFGLAKLLLESGPQLSGDGAVIGTPHYMAPEQIDTRRGAIGPATDVYGLGGLLCCLLTGRPPVEGASTMQVMSEVLSAQPSSRPSTWRRDIPTALDALCVDCLKKDPTQRPATAAEVQQRLLNWLANSRGEKTQEPIARPVARPVVPTARPRGSWVIAGGIGLLLLLAAGLFLSGTFSPTRDQGALTADASPAEKSLATETLPDKAWLADLPAGDVTVDWRVEVFPAGSAGKSEPLTGSIGNDDRLRLQIKLSEPRYVYAYWIGSDGSASLLNREENPTAPVTELSLPAGSGDAFPVQGPAGTEVCLVVLRRTPLTDPTRLEPLLALAEPLPPLDLQVPLADGLPLPHVDPRLAQLSGPTRTLGPAEPLLAGKAGAAIAQWKLGWPRDAGSLHYLAIPHRVQ